MRLLAILLLASPAAAQTHLWANASGGPLNTAANWNPALVPNAGSHVPGFSLAGTYTVTLDSPVTLQGLVGTNASSTIELQPGGRLSMGSNGINYAGTINVLGTTAQVSSILVATGSTLTGAGRIYLNGSDTVASTLSGSGFTIAPNFTIAGGRGSMVSTRTNEGLIVSEGPGIFDIGGTTLNRSTIKAVAGGRMQIRDAIVTAQAAANEIVADGGWIDLIGNTTINNSNIRSINNGTFIVAALSSNILLNNATCTGPIRIRGSFARCNSASGLTLLKGSTLVINDDQITGGTFTFEVAAPLNGPGTVLLNGPFEVNATIAAPTTTGVTLGQTATIAGTGRVQGRWNIAGRIAPGPVAGGVGSMSFNNALVMQPTGVLDLEIATSNPVDIDRLTASTTASDFTAAGTLRVRTVPGFTPVAGLSWPAVTADAITGSFATFDLPPTSNGVSWSAAIIGNQVIVSTTAAPACYANCDGSTAMPALTANDFQCFINKYAANDPYANCDGSTGTPALTANDFQCFINAYAAGCS